MTTNRGTTSLKGRKRAISPMQAYDGLPPELRRWVARAALPWSACSVRSAYRKAIRKTHDPQRALEWLDTLQASLIAKDAARVWGADHPFAAPVARDG